VASPWLIPFEVLKHQDKRAAPNLTRKTKMVARRATRETIPAKPAA